MFISFFFFLLARLMSIVNSWRGIIGRRECADCQTFLMLSKNWFNRKNCARNERKQNKHKHKRRCCVRCLRYICDDGSVDEGIFSDAGMINLLEHVIWKHFAFKIYERERDPLSRTHIDFFLTWYICMARLIFISSFCVSLPSASFVIEWDRKKTKMNIFFFFFQEKKNDKKMIQKLSLLFIFPLFFSFHDRKFNWMFCPARSELGIWRRRKKADPSSFSFLLKCRLV